MDGTGHFLYAFKRNLFLSKKHPAWYEKGVFFLSLSVWAFYECIGIHIRKIEENISTLIFQQKDGGKRQNSNKQ